jgi:hypothetical protein
MTVLRELVARLGFEVDKAGFQAAEQRVAGIRTALGVSGRAALETQRSVDKTGGAVKKAAATSAQAAAQGASAFSGLAQLAAAVGLQQVISQVVHLASDANETANLLEQVFGAEGAKKVQDWSQVMGDAMGRSKYDLREYAGHLGAIIDPMIQNKKRAEEMATSLAALAVDLGSFFEASDSDAQHALQSGLTGEYESLKRFGVVLNDVTLQNYAQTQGIAKKVTAMSIAEKTELRYGFIMKSTANAQGDAARTLGGFENSSKKLSGVLKELATDMGLSVMPKIEALIHAAIKAVDGFKKMARGTYILEAAMIVLGGTAAALALSLLAPFIAPAIAIIGLIALVDELHAMFSGGRSIIGDWLDQLGGKGTTDAVVTRIRGWVDALKEFYDQLPDILGMFELIKGAVDDVGFAIERAMKKLPRALTALVPGLDPAIDGAEKIVSGDLMSKRDESGQRRALYGSGLLRLFRIKPRAWNQEDAEGYNTERSLGAGQTMQGFGDELEYRQRQRFVEIQAARERRRAEQAERATEKENALMSHDPNEREDLGASMAPDPNAIQYGRARVAAPPSASQSQLAPPAPMSVVVNQGANNIVINGGDPRETRRVVQDVLDERTNAAFNAIPNQSGG